MDLNKDGTADVNIDKDGDKKADFNLVNILDNSGKCKLNCNINNFGFPTYNIDLDGDGIPDMAIALNGESIVANIDTDRDGKPDSGIIDTSLLKYETIEENIDLSKDNEFSFTWLGMNDYKKEIVKPGWTKSKRFNISNNGSEKITYKITWEEILNDYHYEVRPKFVLMKNGAEIAKGELLYTPNNGEVLVDNVEINPGETNQYELIYSFSDNQNKSLTDNNFGRTYYSSLKVKSL